MKINRSQFSPQYKGYNEHANCRRIRLLDFTFFAFLFLALISCGEDATEISESCNDGIKNQNELGVDCGGMCDLKCPTCSDGIQNQDEIGVDCGGVCEISCTIAWEKTYGGSSDEMASKVILTSDGGLTFIGSSDSNNGDLVGNKGSLDIWIVHLNQNGEILWQKILGSSSSDIGYGILQTATSEYILVGGTMSNGDWDVFVSKLGENGETIWEKTFGGSGHDMGYHVIETTDNGYAILGYTESTNGDIIGNHGNDILVLKITNNGELLWSKCFGGSATENAGSIIAVDGDGYLIVGSTGSNDGDVSENHGFGYFDVWVLKISEIGEIIWQKSLGGSSDDYGFDVVNTGNGHTLLAASSSLDGNLTTNNGFYDIWFVNLSSSGEMLSQKSWGTEKSEYGTRMITTSDTKFLVVGIRGNQFVEEDILVLKANQSGEVEWNETFGGSYHDGAYSVIQTQDGRIIIGGRTLSNNKDVTNNHGSSDAWLIKLKPK